MEHDSLQIWAVAILSMVIYAFCGAALCVRYMGLFDRREPQIALDSEMALDSQKSVSMEGENSSHNLNSQNLRLFPLLFALLFCFCFGLLLLFGFQVGVIVAAFLLILGVVDYKLLALPDSLSFGFLAACLACALLSCYVEFQAYAKLPYFYDDMSFSFEEPIRRIMLGFGFGGLLFTLKTLYHSLSGRECLGEADILILSGLGIALGVGMAFLSLFVGSVFALLYALFYTWRTESALFTLKIPLCPFLCAGVVGALCIDTLLFSEFFVGLAPDSELPFMGGGVW